MNSTFEVFSPLLLLLSPLYSLFSKKCSNKLFYIFNILVIIYIGSRMLFMEAIIGAFSGSPIMYIIFLATIILSLAMFYKNTKQLWCKKYIR